MQARPGRQRRGTRAPSGTTRGLAPRRPREVARALAERCACGRPRRKEGGAWAEVWRQGSWGWAGRRGLLGRAGGGARSGSGRAGPRRGAGSGGRSVTHAAVREAAAAVAAGAAGTATGARARAGAGCLLSFSCSQAARPGSPQSPPKGRRGAEDADKFPQQPRIPAKAEAAAPTGQQRAPRRSVRPERPRRGSPGPFALGGAVGRDLMRRARKGREIRSPGGARRRRRAVLQLLEPGSGRQEAAERT